MKGAIEVNRQYKYCKNCGRVLAPSYHGDLCPSCIESELFDKVRDFVRENDVNEYDVATHFSIPVRKVKGWIKEGRIEYKEHGRKTVSALYCSRCGARVTFGTLCSKCLKLLNREDRHGFAAVPKGEEGKIRFVDYEEEGRK